ncbi:MAG: hypothetical protein AAF368_07005 [Planctomycetota bacterium]
MISQSLLADTLSVDRYELAGSALTSWPLASEERRSQDWIDRDRQGSESLRPRFAHPKKVSLVPEPYRSVEAGAFGLCMSSRITSRELRSKRCPQGV